MSSFCSLCTDEKSLPQWFNSIGIYYGYVILAVGTLGIWASCPGQTVGISVFSEPLMTALDLSRSQIAFAYLCGTITSSLFLPLAGKCLDSVGPRIFTVSAAISLLVCVIYFSFCDSIYHQLKTLLGDRVAPEYVAFAVAYAGFFCIRQFGQGWLTMGPRTMMANFFDKKRGRMMAISGMGVAFSFGMTPVFFELLITTFGWRHALRFCLGTFMLFMAMVAMLFFRRNPEDCGLLVDGIVSASPTEMTAHSSSSKETQQKKDFTSEEALRTRAFWIYSFGLCGNALLVTANTFHIGYTAALNGVSTQKAFAVFVPAAILSTVSDLLAGFLQEYVDMRVLLAIMNASMLVFLYGMINFDHEYGWWLVAIGQGVAGGMFAQLQGVAFPSLFGTKYLGSISGNVMAFIVGGSALGPYAFTINGGGSGDKALYDRNLAYLAIIPAASLLFSPFASPPSPKKGAAGDDTAVDKDNGGDYELVLMEDESSHDTSLGTDSREMEV